MSLPSLNPRFTRTRVSLGIFVCSLLLLVAIGAMARNNWFPRTDNLTGDKYGWFGAKKSVPPAVAGGSTQSGNPAIPPTPTPQLSKEIIYAGSRMLAVVDANANETPPGDLAVWRPSSGTWYVFNLSTSNWTQYRWGNSTDTPVQGDFDGDGKTDFAIYRPVTGQNSQ